MRPGMFNEKVVANYDSKHGKCLVLLSREQKQTRQGKEILSYLQQVTKVSVGDTVPGYEYVDADGVKHYLSELRGKWLLLDFWSRGCGPCVGAVKELRQLSDEIGGKNLQLVSISVDGEEGWKEASELHRITRPL